LRIVDGRHEVLADLFQRLWSNAADDAVILNPQKQEAAMPIEKCADALIDVTVQLLTTGLELQGYSFSLGNEIVYLLFAQRHGVSLAVFIVVCTVWRCFTRENA